MDERAYQRTKRAFDEAKSKTELPASGYTDLVWQFYKAQSDAVKAERGRA